MIRFGSVCSGIEAASVAWGPLGWQAAWLSEIDPFACAVLKHHYPAVPNFGDMTLLANCIRVGLIEAPDVLCGGTPCQAFSVAGLRRSLDDARGNLSLTFCEIANAIDDARHARGEQPATIFWENVPGVLSTSDNAFGCFLAGLAGEDDPLVAPGGKWTNVGYVLGPKRAVAWRVLDAQYFGVAQRRRRVFVVASAREGFDPAAVLFEFDGVRRDIAPSREAGEGTTHATAPCLTGSGRGVERTGDTRGQDPVVAIQDTSGRDKAQNGRGWNTDGTSYTLDAAATQEVAAPVITMAHGQGGYSPRIARCDATGEAKRQDWETCTIVAQPIAHVDTMPCMTAGGPSDTSHNQISGQMREQYVVPVCVTGQVTHTLKAEGSDASDAGPISPTLRSMGHDGSHANAGGQVAVAVSLRGREGGATAELGDEVGNCLRASGGGGDKAHVLAYTTKLHNTGSNNAGKIFEERTTCLDANSPPPALLTAMQVRRLTPQECELLQGFPPFYTMIPWRKKPASECPDGPRYRALGNSWAVPNVRWIGARIDAALRGA